VLKYFLALVLGACVNLASAQDVKVVYHVTTGIETAAFVLTNISNHLDVDPKAKIVVVTNGPGIDFLIQDAKDSRGREFSAAVSTLADRGVEFRVCKITLTARNISPNKLLMETTVVPSGVVEAARLQAKEGFAYIKP
jgi:intracellular sulfur oxidation DsrE/DsrF family protein